MPTAQTDITVKLRDEFTQGMARLRQELGGVTKDLGIFGSVFAATLGANAVQNAIGGFAGAIREQIGKSIDEFRDFDTALGDLVKVTDESTKTIAARLEDVPSALGNMAEKTRAYYQILSAGVTDPARAMELLVTSSKAAKAAHIDQETSVRAITKTMAGFAGEIRDAAEASDFLFAIERAGQTEWGQEAEVIGDLSKSAHILGIAYQEVGAALAETTQTAGSTSTAATQMRAVMTGLLKPTEGMRDALRSLGYENSQALLKANGLAGALRILDREAKGSERGLGGLFESSEALSGVFSILARNSAGYNEKLKIIRESAGGTAKAFEVYEHTLAGVEERLDNAFSQTRALMFQEIAGVYKDVLYEIGTIVEIYGGKTVDFLRGIHIFLGKIVDVYEKGKDAWDFLTNFPAKIVGLGDFGDIISESQMDMFWKAIPGSGEMRTLVEGLTGMAGAIAAIGKAQHDLLTTGISGGSEVRGAFSNTDIFGDPFDEVEQAGKALAERQAHDAAYLKWRVLTYTDTERQIAQIESDLNRNITALNKEKSLSDEEKDRLRKDMTTAAEKAITAVRTNAAKKTAAELKKIDDEYWSDWKEQSDAGADAFIKANEKIIKGREELADTLKELNDITWEAESEAVERATKDAEEAARDQQTTWDRMFSNIQDQTADTFYNLFKDVGDGWETLTDSILDGFLRLLSQMAAQAIMQPIIIPMVQGALGGSAGFTAPTSGGFPGWDGILNVFGNGNSGQGYGGGGTWEDIFGGIPGVGGPTAGSDNSFLGMLGTGLAGAAGGFSLYKLLGLPDGGYSGLGSGLGGAGGALVGSILGPIGSIIGGILGSLGGGFLGSLFGGDDKPDDLDLTYYGGGTSEKGARKSGRYNYALKAKDFGKDQGHKHQGEDLEKATISYLDNYFTGIEDAFDIDLGPLIEKMDFNLNDVQDQINEKHDVPEVMLKKLFKNYLDDWKTTLASSDKAYATTLVSGFEDISDQNELKDWLDNAIQAIPLAEGLGQAIAGWMDEFGLNLDDMISELSDTEQESFKKIYGGLFESKTGLEQVADQINGEVDSYVKQLQDLGVDDAFIAGVEAMRDDLIAAAQQAMRDSFNFDLDQRELVATGQSGEASKRARLKSQTEEYDAAVKTFGDGSEEVARLLRIQAQENQALADAMMQNVDLYIAEVTGNQEGAAWMQLQIKHQQMWNQAIAAGLSEDQLNILRDTMQLENDLFIAQQERAKKERTEDLQVRLLRAQGNDEEADAMALQLSHERELQDAKDQGWTAEQIALLLQIQAAEDLQDAAEAAAQAAADAEAAFQTMQDAVFDLQGKFLELGFNPSQAMQGKFTKLTAAEKQRGDLDMQLSQMYAQMLSSGITSQTIFKAFGDYEKLAWQALERSIAQEKARSLEDLELRKLTAQGDDAAAEALKKRLDLEREYQDAVDEGRDADYLAMLKQTQAYELLQWAQEQQAETLDDLAKAYQDAADSLSDTIRELTYSEELSTLNPQQRLAKLRQEFNTVSAQALAGDAEAMKSLGSLGKEYESALKAYYGPTGAYASESERVMGILSTAKTLAETFAEDPLTAPTFEEYSQAQLDQLTQMTDYLATIADSSQQTQWRDLLHAWGVPGYASGGYHPGGWAVVGEQGPEFLNLGPARIFDATTSAALSRSVAGGDGNKEMVLAVNRLTKEFTAYRQQQADEQTALRRQNTALIRENRELRLKADRQAAK